jgi:hypothetical protein
MKYIITESKLEESIMNYLDTLFEIDNLHFVHPYEYDDKTGREREDPTRITFYINDYLGDEEGCFKWYDCDYFYPDTAPRKFCPTIELDYSYSNTLNGYFGDIWHEPFKKWINLHFGLPVKTVDEF